jgi:hypothetical protein
MAFTGVKKKNRGACISSTVIMAMEFQQKLLLSVFFSFCKLATTYIVSSSSFLISQPNLSNSLLSMSLQYEVAPAGDIHHSIPTNSATKDLCIFA